MAHTLTDHTSDLIRRLIHSGRYNNRSEVVRAGLRLLEEKEFNYLNPSAAKDSQLARAYRRQRSDNSMEVRATKTSRRRSPNFDE
ncbi:MAG TPA: type II toxin-antitoxin system ParD family antitoxin [Verrucomicrobiae bacterium]|jgi:antitoxin ParD1/3/4